MSLKDALVAGLESVPDCQTVCYVDMSSGLVLASQAHSPRPQEFYDKIGSLAARLLQDAPFAAATKTLVGDEDEADSRAVYLFGAGCTHVFVKSKNFPEHAICYMSASTADPDALSARIMANREVIANAM